MSRLWAKHWTIALVISLALNAMLGGMMLTRCARGQPPTPDGMFPRPLHGLRRDLDPATYPSIDRVDAAHAARIEERMRDVSDARLRAMTALSAESFDEKEASEALADFRSKVGAAHDELHAALIELAASLTPAQRKALGDAWGRAGYRRGPPEGAGRGQGRGPGHRGRGGHGGPPGAASRE